MPHKILFDVDMRSVRWTASDLRAIKKAVRHVIQHVIPALCRDPGRSNHGAENTAPLSRQPPGQFLRHFAPRARGDSFSVSIVLATNKHIQKLNAKWRSKNKSTNVLSFPAGELEHAKIWPAKIPLPLGDLVFAHETCAREAQNFNIQFRHYIMFLAVHGTLHLLGHDHETNAQYQKMMAAELQILKQLKLANPYPFMQNAPSNA